MLTWPMSYLTHTFNKMSPSQKKHLIRSLAWYLNFFHTAVTHYIYHHVPFEFPFGAHGSAFNDSMSVPEDRTSWLSHLRLQRLLITGASLEVGGSFQLSVKSCGSWMLKSRLHTFLKYSSGTARNVQSVDVATNWWGISLVCLLFQKYFKSF